MPANEQFTLSKDITGWLRIRQDDHRRVVREMVRVRSRQRRDLRDGPEQVTRIIQRGPWRRI